MKRDPTTQGMCTALEPQFRQLATETKLCLIYSRIDELDEPALDELAWQFHVDFYDSGADISTKRTVVKNSLVIHMTKGTPYAVETLISTIFGDGQVLDWYEYGGKPYYFKVLTSNQDVTTAKLQQFTKALNSVKNTRSYLEAIEVTATDEMNLNFGVVVHIADYMEIRQVV